MHLKRFYNHDAPKDDWNVRVDPETGDEKRVPPITHVKVLSWGKNQKQIISTQLLASAQKDGWLVHEGGRIKMVTDGDPEFFKIVRGPGTYCCHCGMEMPDNNLAKSHIETKHNGEPCPDPNNPSGYEKIAHYECVREGE